MGGLRALHLAREQNKMIGMVRLDEIRNHAMKFKEDLKSDGFLKGYC